MQFCIWTLHTDAMFHATVFYFTYCATAEMKQFRRLEREFVLLFQVNVATSITSNARELAGKFRFSIRCCCLERPRRHCLCMKTHIFSRPFPDFVQGGPKNWHNKEVNPQELLQNNILQ